MDHACDGGGGGRDGGGPCMVVEGVGDMVVEGEDGMVPEGRTWVHGVWQWGEEED